MSREEIEFEIWNLNRVMSIAETYAKQSSTPEITKLHLSFIDSCKNLINELKLKLEEEI